MNIEEGNYSRSKTDVRREIIDLMDSESRIVHFPVDEPNYLGCWPLPDWPAGHVWGCEKAMQVIGYQPKHNDACVRGAVDAFLAHCAHDLEAQAVPASKESFWERHLAEVKQRGQPLHYPCGQTAP
jgi:hypothetical protein